MFSANLNQTSNFHKGKVFKIVSDFLNTWNVEVLVESAGRRFHTLKLLWVLLKGLFNKERPEESSTVITEYVSRYSLRVPYM